MPEIIGTFATGLLAGTLGGLLGIGGGIVLMPVLRFIIGISPPLAAGTCIVAVFFTTVGGSWRHYRLGHVNVRSLIPIIATGACSTVIFSLIFAYFATRERWLDLGMGLVFSLVSIRMMVEGATCYTRKKVEGIGGAEIRGSLLSKFAIGSAAGALPGLLGIGTGAVLVPVFTFLSKAPIKVAIGSSLTCFAVNALVSSAFKFSQGFIHLKLALPVCLGTFVGATMGATLNKRFSSATLKLSCGVVFLYVSSRFVASFVG